MARNSCLGMDGRINLVRPRQIFQHYFLPIRWNQMIKQIGNTLIRNYHRASCHCGAVVLEIYLPEGVPAPSYCDCSFCKRKGAIGAAIASSSLRIIQGEEWLTTYKFGGEIAEHFFCRNCGIHTHHRRSNNPAEFGFNVGCLEAVNPFDLENVPIEDGRPWQNP